MSMRADRWQPRYVDNAAVTSSGTITGGNLALDGATAISIQALLSNGATGTLYVDATNIDGQASSYATVTSQSLPANGSGYFTYTLVDQVTPFAIMRVRFVASAAGNVTIATNIRRPNP